MGFWNNIYPWGQQKESSRRVAFDSEQALCSVDLHQSVMTSKEDRVSLWYDAMDANCQKGEAYCWMSCMEVPQPCQPYDQHRSELQCKNPKNNVTCRLQKNDTGAMDPGCAWQCNNKPVPYKSDFCNGAMDMLMSGFEGAGEPSNPCVILFFEAWTLDTRVKFRIRLCRRGPPGVHCRSCDCLEKEVLHAEATLAFLQNAAQVRLTFVQMLVSY